jgi:hypothetical protein
MNLIVSCCGVEVKGKREKAEAACEIIEYSNSQQGSDVTRRRLAWPGRAVAKVTRRISTGD